MRFIFYSILLFVISACSSTISISPKTETDTMKKIFSNKSVASQAQNEYKELQVKRERE